MKLQKWPERLGRFKALEFLRGYFSAFEGLYELAI